MSFGHGKASRVYVNGFDLTSFLNKYDMPRSQETADVTTFNLAAKVYLAGRADGTISFEGVYSKATASPPFDQVGDVLGENGVLPSASSTVWSFLPQGDIQGAPVAFCSAFETDWAPHADAGDAVKFKGTAQASGGLILQGVDHHILQAEVATGNDATVDNLVASANGGYAYFQCTAIAGASPNVTFEIHHSTDNFGANDVVLGTFTAITVANKAQLIVIALGTAVSRYTRFRRVFGGTTTSITYNAGFARG